MFYKLKDKIREKNYNKVNNFFGNSEFMLNLYETNFIKNGKDILRFKIIFGDKTKKNLRLKFLQDQTLYRLQDLRINDCSIVLYAKYDKRLKKECYIFPIDIDKPISIIVKD